MGRSRIAGSGAMCRSTEFGCTPIWSIIARWGGFCRRSIAATLVVAVASPGAAASIQAVSTSVATEAIRVGD